MILEIKLNGMQLHVYNISEKEVTLGRGKEADYSINAEEVSRLHCSIKEVDGKFYVKDLKSANGTFVYDEKLLPDAYCEFLTEFPIRLGKTIQIFVLDEEPVSDVDEYGVKKKKRVSAHDQTRIFSGIVKKSVLKNKNEQKKSPLIFILPLVVIALGGLYYFWYGSQFNRPITSKLPVVQTPAPVKVKLPYPETGCFYDDEKSLCQAMMLPQGDYVALNNNELSLVVNLSRIIENESAELTTLPEEVKMRFIVIQLMNQLYESASTMTLPTELTKLVLYGVSADYQQLNMKLVFDVPNAPKPEEVRMALEAAVASGSMADFEAQFGQFFKVE